MKVGKSMGQTCAWRHLEHSHCQKQKPNGDPQQSDARIRGLSSIGAAQVGEQAQTSSPTCSSAGQSGST